MVRRRKRQFEAIESQTPEYVAIKDMPFKYVSEINGYPDTERFIRDYWSLMDPVVMRKSLRIRIMNGFEIR